MELGPSEEEVILAEYEPGQVPVEQRARQAAASATPAAEVLSLLDPEMSKEVWIALPVRRQIILHACLEVLPFLTADDAKQLLDAYRHRGEAQTQRVSISDLEQRLARIEATLTWVNAMELFKT